VFKDSDMIKNNVLPKLTAFLWILPAIYCFAHSSSPFALEESVKQRNAVPLSFIVMPSDLYEDYSKYIKITIAIISLVQVLFLTLKITEFFGDGKEHSRISIGSSDEDYYRQLVEEM
jgi:hypothetical protein